MAPRGLSPVLAMAFEIILYFGERSSIERFATHTPLRLSSL
jgi:hypothetical protein